MQDYRIENPYEKNKKRSAIKLIIAAVILLVGIGAAVIFFHDDIATIADLVVGRLNENKTTVNDVKNEYYINENFVYYQNIDILHPKNKQELVNALRTVANAGVDKFSFYVDKSYTDWLTDLTAIQPNFRQLIGFNHPFNETMNISAFYNKTTRRVDLEFSKEYTDEQIKEINKEIDRLYDELYNSNLSIEENIKKFNNYIIEHTEYDYEFLENKKSDYHSGTAYGVLFEGKGICLGYADTMYLFLEKMGLKQFRIINDTHAWNVVNIDNSWKHIDVTWNDTMDGEGSTYHTNAFLLIDTNRLWGLDIESHSFDQEIYIEAIN